MVLSVRTTAVGDRRTATVADGLTRSQIVQYAGASGDFNPLHTDEVFAVEVAGHRSTFAHGMLTMGLTARALTDLVGDGRLTRFGGRLLAQVWPGDTLTVTMEVTELGELDGSPTVHLDVTTRNQDDVVVFSGYADARADR